MLRVVLCFLVILTQASCNFDYYDHLRATRARCDTDSDCGANSSCQQGGFCQCNKGYVFFEDICVSVGGTTLGGPCIADIQCEVSFGEQAECSQNKCECESDSHFAESKCHKSKLLGEKCATKSDCWTANGSSVSCVYSKCECYQGYHPNKDKTDCITDLNLGDSCQVHEECVAPGAMCYGKCSCQAGFVPSKDQLSCLPVAHELGSSCEVDPQCEQFLPLSACVELKCGCQQGAHERQDKCWKTCGLGGFCEVWQQCWTPSDIEDSVTCDLNTKRCVCNKGFTSQNRDCKPNAATNIQKNSLKFLVISNLISYYTMYILNS